MREVSKVEKYIEALKGISYFEWIKLREGMDNEFNRLIGESKRKLELTDVERVEKAIRSQFGYGYVQEGGEDMNEIATVMNEEEFGYFLKSFEKKADLKSLSLISRRCQVVDTLCGLQSDIVLTVGQIKQLFELAN